MHFVTLPRMHLSAAALRNEKQHLLTWMHQSRIEKLSMAINRWKPIISNTTKKKEWWLGQIFFLEMTKQTILGQNVTQYLQYLMIFIIGRYCKKLQNITSYPDYNFFFRVFSYITKSIAFIPEAKCTRETQHSNRSKQ